MRLSLPRHRPAGGGASVGGPASARLRLLKKLVAAGALGAAVAAQAYKELPPPPQVVLPRALTPAESLAAIKVASGLEVELVAAEPMTMDPVDLAFGPDGRMWVVEMADYPEGIGAEGKPGGRVRVLESTRNDGRYDRSTLFADGLKYPTSAVPWRNGVLVVAIPDILFLEDTDGDGRSDRRTVLYTGIADGNPQHLANGLQWSWDGWLHLANGDSGGKVRSVRTGTTLELGRRDFRIRPDDGGLEFLTGQTQVGRAGDDWGNWFGCNNSNPFWHYALEERYLRRNPHFVPPGATVSVSAVPGAAPVFPRSETLARFNDPHGRNHFTSACNVTIYRDDFLGPGYAGGIFVSEPVHNLVSRQVLRPAGATFTSDRAPGEKAAEFLASTDNWSRFAGIRAGPDGALYIADMYRLVVEHPKWIPEAWRRQLGDLRAGETQGRIYRVRPKGAALRPVPRLDRATPAELVQALGSVSGVVRDLAQQQLLWRGAREAATAVRALATQSTRPAARAQAWWTLQGLGALDPAGVQASLADPDPGVRRQAVRLAENWAGQAPELLEAILPLANDPDAALRQQVAYTLGEFRDRRIAPVLARLLAEHEDRYVRAAAMSSALPHAEALAAEFARRGEADTPLAMEIAAATDNARALTGILAAIAARESAPADQLRSLGQLLDWLARHNRTLAQVATAGGAGAAETLARVETVFGLARRWAVDSGVAAADRVAAVRVLGRGRTRQNEDLELLAGLLVPQQAAEVQLAAVAALGRMNRSTVPERLLGGWAAHGPRVRAAVLQLLIGRPAWAQVLLDRVEKDRTWRAQIDPASRLALTQHSNARLALRATDLFRDDTTGDRAAVVARYREATSRLTGQAARGAEVFARACSVCHAFGPQVPGRPIGPDLAAVKDRTPEYLLAHILDPNRAVEDRYVLYTAATADGRALAGMLAGESSSSLTLVGLDGTEQTLLRSELRSLLSTGRSLMPEGLEAAVDEAAMADLLALLGGVSSPAAP